MQCYPLLDRHQPLHARSEHGAIFFLIHAKLHFFCMDGTVRPDSGNTGGLGAFKHLGTWLNCGLFSKERLGLPRLQFYHCDSYLSVVIHLFMRVQKLYYRRMKSFPIGSKFNCTLLK